MPAPQHLQTRNLDGQGRNTSLGLYPRCNPISTVASEFFSFSTSSHGYGPESEGVMMHRPESVKYKHEAQALIITPLDKPESKNKGKEQEIDPGGHFYKKGVTGKDWVYRPDWPTPEGVETKCVPKSSEGQKSSEAQKSTKKQSKRAEPEVEEPPPDNDFDETEPDPDEPPDNNNAEANPDEEPSENSLVKIEMVYDEIPNPRKHQG
ncbi:hypothetical protein CDD83_1379 [Cordyceps sp. RAO-2017]|nr:hypothetical protein CDD83_1379 [Cordyceps sp. RAO-2017]